LKCLSSARLWKSIINLPVLALATSLAGCPLFAAGGDYTRPIASAPVDRNSEHYMQSMIDAGNAGGFWIAANPVETINVATSLTPTHRVRPKVSYHGFNARYPWNGNFRIEPLGDAHAIVLLSSTCELFEMYQTSFVDGELSAYSGAHWNLTRPFKPLPPGTPSAMASGLSLFAGMVRWEEVALGSIDHALNWAAPAGTVAQWSFVSPASDAEGIPFKGSGSWRLPYGARLRLRASFDISQFGPQSAAIARAMKRYGIYLADTASANELYNSVAMDGSNQWNASDLAALGSIHISDFDVVRLPPIQRVPGR
jgi:hypothetical protein